MGWLTELTALVKKYDSDDIAVAMDAVKRSVPYGPDGWDKLVVALSAILSLKETLGTWDSVREVIAGIQVSATGIAHALDPVLKTKLDMRLPHYNERHGSIVLSVRAANCLQNANIRYIGELVQKTERELLQIKNFGRASLREIKALLRARDLRLGIQFLDWTPPQP